MEQQSSKTTIIKKVFFIILGLGVLVFIFWYVNTYIYQFLAGDENKARISVSSQSDEIVIPEDNSAVEYEVIFQISPPSSGAYVSGFQFLLTYDTDILSYKSLDPPPWADVILDEEEEEGSRRIIMVADEPMQIEGTPLTSFPLTIIFNAQDGAETETITQQTITLVGTGAEVVGADNTDMAAEFSPPDDMVKIVSITRSTTQEEPTPTFTPTPEITPDEDDAYLGFAPTSSAIERGQQSTVQLTINTGGTPVAAADLVIEYDPAIIEYKSLSADDSVFDTVAINSSSGRLSIIGTIDTQGEGTSQDGVVATIVFEGIAAGTTSLEYFCEPGTNGSSGILLPDIDATDIINCDVLQNHTITVSNPDAPTATPTHTPAPTSSSTPLPTQLPTTTPLPPVDTPTPTRPPTSTTEDVVLNMKLRFQGVTRQPAAALDTLNVQVELVSERFTERSIVTFKSDGNAIWSGRAAFSRVPVSQKFSILIKGPKHLSKRVCVINPRENVAGTYNCDNDQMELKAGDNDLDLSNITLLAGDLPIQNSVVDSADIVYIRQNFGNQGSDAIARGDLNLDGIVDTQDFALVLAALGFKYDEDL